MRTADSATLRLAPSRARRSARRKPESAEEVVVTPRRLAIGYDKHLGVKPALDLCKSHHPFGGQACTEVSVSADAKSARAKSKAVSVSR
jgi:hypothetical protein